MPNCHLFQACRPDFKIRKYDKIYRMNNKTVRVAVVDDHIVPYRLTLFNHISKMQDIDLKVFYCTRKLREREWKITDQYLEHNFRILPGFVLHLLQGYHEPRSILFPLTLFFDLMLFNPDVVVGYAFSIPALQTVFYCCLFRKPYVSWATGTPHTERNYSHIQKFLRKKIIGFAQAFITASNQGVDNFVQLGADRKKVKVVLQVPDTQFIRVFDEILNDQKPSYSQRNKLSSPVILFVGFLSERKGVMDLLEAFSYTHQNHPTATLLMAGHGPLEEPLRKRAHELSLDEAVHFAGFIQPPDLPYLYAGADVFVLPTLSDNFGVVLTEAAACGVPLISTPYAGATDHFIEPGKNGYVVDPQEHQALADAISRVLANPNVPTMGQLSRQKARENPLSASADKFLDALFIALNIPRT